MKSNLPSDNLPDHLIADPTPSQVEQCPATFVLRLKTPASLWIFPDDDENNGQCIRFLDQGHTMSAPELARIAREVGDFWNQYRQEEAIEVTHRQ